MHRERGNLLTTSGTQGFTLIELLVVVFIISVMAGMLMAVMWRAQGKARGTYCVSGMRQVLLGLQMYMADHDEIPVDVHDTIDEDGNVVTPGNRWTTAVFPYVRSKDVFICPADPEKGEGRKAAGIPLSWIYLYNLATMERGPNGTPKSVAADSPVLECTWHLDSDNVLIIGRKDASVEAAPARKYGDIGVVFE
jgi:prepilin-type N-terminal cleavage/methylation domain-containing protein